MEIYYTSWGMTHQPQPTAAGSEAVFLANEKTRNGGQELNEQHKMPVSQKRMQKDMVVKIFTSYAKCYTNFVLKPIDKMLNCIL
jgi:hypothetical protein